MTERELLYVKRVAEEKSISKAAERLFISQPSLSVSIQKIEERLGLRLFRRTHRGLIPTFEGERYCQMASNILKIYSDFKIEVSEIQNMKKGRLIMGITVYLATHILPTLLATFRREYPHIEVVIVERNSSELEKALLSGEIDFAVMHTSPFEELAQMDTQIYPLLKDPMLLVTSEDHPLSCFANKQKKSTEIPEVDLELFSLEPFIMLQSGQKIRQVTDLILQKAQINPPVILTTKSYETARRLACEGIGVTIIPCQYREISPIPAKGSYFRLAEELSPYWTLCIAMPPKTYISRAAQLFINKVCSQFNKPTIF